jgi:ubiquinone/menaquinone biosynthesis C-methylase UbiE
MQVRDFENKKWLEHPIGIQRWHIEAMKMVKKDPVLDIGGGDGIFANLQAHGFRNIIVVDISPVAIEKARQLGIEAYTLDVTQLPLPFEDRSFATVTLLGVAGYVVRCKVKAL